VTFFRYTVARLAAAIPVVFAILLINFVIIHMAPGDPATILAGDFATPDTVEAIRQHYGLDKPMPVQIVTYFGHLLRGDLGFSYGYDLPVTSIIGSRAVATILLLLSSQALGIAFGVVLGTVAAQSYGSRADAGISAAAAIANSLPVFWLGLMMILVFSIWLKVLPTSGMSTVTGTAGGVASWIDVLKHLVMPATSLAAVWVAPNVLRVTRASVLHVAAEQFAVTARAKGVPERRVLFHHILRNAMLPNLTVIGLNLSLAISGALLTETVFGWPGMGRLMYEAMFQRDYPLLMGVFTVTAVLVVLGTIAVDLLYRVFDPRVELW